MAERMPACDSSDRAAVANFVATLSSDLAGLARQTGMDALGYLLEMVRLEAENIVRHSASTERTSPHRGRS